MAETKKLVLCLAILALFTLLFGCTNPNAPACGNGICDKNAGETIASCPSDCNSRASFYCGDGICNATERANPSLCPQDCGRPATRVDRCREGFDFNRQTRKCESSAATYTCSNGTYNTETGLCEIQPPTEEVCAQGTYNAEANLCEIQPSTAYNCAEGTYNSQTQQCEIQPETTYTCEQGQLVDAAGQKVCVVEITSENTCSEQSGHICAPNQTCTGNWIDASDTVLCCGAACALKGCSDQGGNVCLSSQICAGNLMGASDTSTCCSAACRAKTCSEQSGSICSASQTCSGSTIGASDTDSCCIGACSAITHMLTQVIPEKVVFSGSNYFRPEIIAVNDRLFAAWTIKGGSKYQLVELNDDLNQKGGVFDIYSYRTSIDIRLATDGSNLWYAFQSLAKQDAADCNSIFLCMAKYDISGSAPSLANTKLDIAAGCPFDNRNLRNYPQNPELVDDPTPVFYDGKYVVLTRAWKGTVQHIRTFDQGFNLLEDFTLDLNPLITGNEFLSQNALVDIDGKPYIIGGLGTLADSSIYAIPLSEDLRSVSGEAIPLVKEDGVKFSKTTSAKYVDGKLYINYAKSEGTESFQYLGVFDVKNGFSPLYNIQFQNKSVNANHSAIEVIGNRVYVIYQEDQKDNYDLLMQAFEWK